MVTFWKRKRVKKKEDCKLSIPKQNYLYYIMSRRDGMHEMCLEFVASIVQFKSQ